MLKLAKTHISLNFFHSSISKNCIFFVNYFTYNKKKLRTRQHIFFTIFLKLFWNLFNNCSNAFWDSSLVTCLYSSIVKFSTWSSISTLFNSKVSGFLVQWSIICWSVKISDVGSSLSRAICSSAVFVLFHQYYSMLYAHLFLFL